MKNDFTDAVRSFGASDVAAAIVDDGPGSLPYAVSVAVRLSDAIVGEIAGDFSAGGTAGPTYTYFNHYRSVNYLIDQILLKTGLYLQDRGARWISVAASQSRPDSAFEGRYSHKKAACRAGLGTIGRNGLFLHHAWGPRVRLGTVFTDWTGCAEIASADIGDASRSFLHSACAGCGRCVAACPAGALGPDAPDAPDAPAGQERWAGVSALADPDGAGTDASSGVVRACGDRLAAFDPERCSAWMKKAYRDIGRGAVCGICMAVCPAGTAFATRGR